MRFIFITQRVDGKEKLINFWRVSTYILSNTFFIIETHLHLLGGFKVFLLFSQICTVRLLEPFELQLIIPFYEITIAPT
jgi:hypothetical protein